MAVSRAVGDTACLAEGLRALGFQRLSERTIEAATPLLDESLALYRGLRNQQGEVFVLHYLSAAALDRGEPEAARTLAEDCLARALDDPVLRSYGLVALANVTEQTGDYAAARGFAGDVIQLSRGREENTNTILARIRLARLWLREGDATRAAPLLAEALRVIGRTGLRMPLVAALRLTAQVALLRADATGAARLVGAAEAHWERGQMRTQFELVAPAEQRAAVRAALGVDAFTTAYAEGRALALDEAVALALEQTEEATAPR